MQTQLDFGREMGWVTLGYTYFYGLVIIYRARLGMPASYQNANRINQTKLMQKELHIFYSL